MLAQSIPFSSTSSVPSRDSGPERRGTAAATLGMTTTDRSTGLKAPARGPGADGAGPGADGTGPGAGGTGPGADGTGPGATEADGDPRIGVEVRGTDRRGADADTKEAEATSRARRRVVAMRPSPSWT